MLERYLTAFAQAYDPHSDYMTASSVEDFDIGMKLSLFGIGALLTSEDGAAKVERIIPGGPADRDGRLKAGDRIIAVGQGREEPVDVMHWPLSKTVRLIRGEKGTTVVLTIIPAANVSGAATRRIALKRDEVKLEEQGRNHHPRPLPAHGLKLKAGTRAMAAACSPMARGADRATASCLPAQEPDRTRPGHPPRYPNS